MYIHFRIRMLASKSVLTFRREDDGEILSAKVFGSCRTTTRNRADNCCGEFMKLAGHAREPIGGIPVQWRREGAPSVRIFAPTGSI
jgi:hypothetical protein